MSDKIYPVKEKRESEFSLIADQFFSWSHKSTGICGDDPLIDLKWPLDYEKGVLITYRHVNDISKTSSPQLFHQK